MHTHFNDLKPKTVLAVAAHPDDLEDGVGGTVAKWVANGADVHFLILTHGDKGSEDKDIDCDELASKREQEQSEAAKILGVKEVQFRNYPDGALEVTMDLKKDIVKVIRQIKPDVVVTLDPTVIFSNRMGEFNHPDHRAAGLATIDAIYPLARDHLSFPELLDENLEPHKVKSVLLINRDNPNYFEDISGTLDTKLEALFAHKSQFPDHEFVEQTLTTLASEQGQECRCRYAESFVRYDQKFN